MSVLDQFSEEDRLLLISLPYRVGLWISQSDVSGGDESDEQELQTLSNLLSGMAEGVFGSETVQHVISETIARRDLWGEWDARMDTVLGDCRRGIELLQPCVDEKEVKAFKRHLFEIGEAVALAYREYGTDMPLADRVRMNMRYYSGLLRAKLRHNSFYTRDEYFNISIAERAALEMLCDVLWLPTPDRKEKGA